MSFLGIKRAFFSKMTRRICTKFFSGRRRKHLSWCSQSTTVLFQSIRLHQVLSEPWRRSIYASSRNNSIKELFHHLGI